MRVSASSPANVRYGWCGDFRDVELELVTELRVRGERGDIATSLRRYKRIDEYGWGCLPEHWTPGSRYNADGIDANGLLGVGQSMSTFVSLGEGDEKNVVVELSFSWTTSRGSGEWNDKVRLEVGRDTEMKLKDGAVLKVTWRKPA